jgi:hypothetical protein
MAGLDTWGRSPQNRSAPHVFSPVISPLLPLPRHRNGSYTVHHSLIEDVWQMAYGDSEGKNSDIVLAKKVEHMVR